MTRAEAGRPRSIYVEILVRGTLDELWRLTQTPELHQRWDLRFGEIEYLPWPDEALPQRFLYATRIGLGLAVRGLGESVGGCEVGSGIRGLSPQVLGRGPAVVEGDCQVAGQDWSCDSYERVGVVMTPPSPQVITAD